MLGTALCSVWWVFVITGQYYYCCRIVVRPAPYYYRPIWMFGSVRGIGYCTLAIHQAAVLLYCCIAVLLYCSIAVLLYCCITVLLYCSIAVLLYCSIAVLQYCCIGVCGSGLNGIYWNANGNLSTLNSTLCHRN
jgi:hypothetical protein